MNQKYLDQDKEGISTKGVIGTTIIHALLLLLFFFLTLNAVAPKPEHQGLLINFGNADQGFGEEQPTTDAPPVVEEETTSENVEESTPEPQTPEKQTPKPIAENKSQTAKNTDAPSLPEKDLNKKTDPKKTETKKTEKKPTPTKPKTPTPTKTTPKPDAPKADKPTPKPTEPVETKPDINTDALFKGSKNSSGGQGTDGSKDEDLGSKMGDVKITPNTGDTPSGEGSGGVGVSLSGRRALSLPKPQDDSQEVGKVVISIKVDRNGNVLEATYTSSGSTTANANLRRKAIDAAKKAKFNVSYDSPEVQTGTLSYTFSVR
ncbi:MAG: hypothetical protein R3E32_26905 [Chitinophagales bacterium]